MITTLDKIDASVSKQIMELDANDLHLRIGLSINCDLISTDSFPQTPLGVLSKHFLIACQTMQDMHIYAIAFMIKIVRAIEEIEKHYKIPKKYSILERLTADIISDAYKSTPKLTGNAKNDIRTCLESLEGRNIPILNMLFERMRDDDEEKPANETRWVIINFFIIMNRIEKGIEMGESFGL